MLFFLALVVASLPSRVGPITSQTRALTAASGPFVAVIPQIGLYDLTAGPRAVHEWKSRKPVRRMALLSGGAAIVPPTAPLVGAAAPGRPRDGRPSAVLRRAPLRHFDARGPPATA